MLAARYAAIGLAKMIAFSTTRSTGQPAAHTASRRRLNFGRSAECKLFRRLLVASACGTAMTSRLLHRSSAGHFRYAAGRNRPSMATCFGY